MEIVEATFQIVTPMFIGGADQEPSDGVRPPSVKGALRFWWRALNWGRFRAECSCDELALMLLHDEEARLFGGSAKHEGQGCFLLTVRHSQLSETVKGNVHQSFKPTKQKTRNGQQEIDENDMAAARYLGYGLMAAFTSKDRETKEIKFRAGQLDRGCLNEDQSFTVVLIFRNSIDESILRALKVFGLLGGLGSRSRHGMGSVTLETIICNQKEKIWEAQTTQEGYQTEVKALIGALAGVPKPEYSAFSDGSRVDCLLSDRSPYVVLDQLGVRVLDYRSWGQSSRDNILPSSKKSEKRFEDDHKWFREADTFRPANLDFHPKRVAFGLPHNYDSKNKKHMVNAVNYERRASPLFFHVHRLSDKEYIGISVLLKSRFLPDGEKINAGGKHVDQNINWAVITDFLDGKAGNPPTSTNRFPRKKAVLP